MSLSESISPLTINPARYYSTGRAASQKQQIAFATIEEYGKFRSIFFTNIETIVHVDRKKNLQGQKSCCHHHKQVSACHVTYFNILNNIFLTALQ